MAKGKKSFPNTRHWKGAMLRDSVPGIMNLAWKIAFGKDKPDIDMVKIPNKDYYIGRTTVTQKLWWEVIGTQPWRGEIYVREGDDYPAVCVSWEDATAFCEKLSKKEGKTYRLPTETEWEYACLADATTPYHFGDDPADLSKYAWFEKNAWNEGEQYAHRVAEKLPNKFGLYDMHGNVFEWCSDWHNENQKSRVLRGGSWDSSSDGCSACFRYYDTPTSRLDFVGFRLAIST